MKWKNKIQNRTVSVLETYQADYWELLWSHPELVILIMQIV